MSVVIIMKLVSVFVKGFNVRQVGSNKNNVYTFLAMESDLNGARIPVELQTFNEDIKNKLIPLCNSQDEVLIPFSTISTFRGTNQYSVDDLILHPDFTIQNLIA